MERNKRKVLFGIVRKKSGTKTINVEVQQMMRHAQYKKVIKVTKKFLVHDEESVAKVGQSVYIAETRPISKSKNCRVVKVEEN